MPTMPGDFNPEMDARLEQREVTERERELEEDLEGQSDPDAPKPDPDAPKPGLLHRVKDALNVFPDAKE